MPGPVFKYIAQLIGGICWMALGVTSSVLAQQTWLPPIGNTAPVTAPTLSLGGFPPAARAARWGDAAWVWCPDFSPSGAERSQHGKSSIDHNAPIDADADSAQVLGEDTVILCGNVHLQRPGESLESDWLLHDMSLDTVQSQHQLRLNRGPLTVDADYGLLDLQTDRGQLDNAQYQLKNRHARGTAHQVQLENANLSHYWDATYTTCSPGQSDWELHADRLDLDQEKGSGIGRGVSVWFKDVPLFYTPYLSFPLTNKRESGFLAPTLGRSSVSGLDLRLPYYWNIAPNEDATFTTRFLGRRGVQFHGEGRYLTPASRGQLDVEVLPSDQLYGGDRGQLSFRHQGLLTPQLSTDITFGAVSDRDYFHDLGNDLRLTSISYLERRGDLYYSGDNWRGLARLQGFQTLDGSDPFQRLPQLQVNGAFPIPARYGNYNGLAEVSHFDRRTGYTGNRLWLEPAVSYPFTNAWGFLRPRLALHHVSYGLEGTDVNLPTAPSLTLPIVSLDSGLFLERDITLGERAFVQTLEPRLYYLYVPYRDQHNLPVFDTTLLDFGFGQLFQSNRFSGPDRLGDANQLALAVTSRLLDRTTGRQWLYGSLGQIIYFQDRQVNLDYTLNPLLLDNGQGINRSDVVAEAGLQLTNHWSASTTLQWNEQQGNPEQKALRLQYQKDQDHIFNAAYRARRDLLEQADLSAVWPLTNHWRAVGYWEYSLRDAQTLEALAGVRYESCCWAATVMARSYVNLPGEQPQNDVLLQLELKGLGNIGDHPESLLTRGILGYQPQR